MFEFLKKSKEFEIEPEKNCIYAPVKGTVIPLSEVNDDMFSQEMLGKGVAIKPEDNTFYAPVSGTVTVAAKSSHAIAITTEEGLEVLVHIGIDTVELNGEYFKKFVNPGEKIRAGQRMVTFEGEKIRQSGYDTVTMIIVTNSSDYNRIEPKVGISVNEMDKVIEIG